MYQTKTTATKSKARRITTIILGFALAMGGIHHGFFEILQGNTPTNGMFIESIGPDHRMWLHGNDPAVTLIPNFLYTGMASVVTGILIIFWTIFFIDKKHGPSIFLLLFILLTLTGGGIGHIPFFILSWAYATNTRSDLNWWKKNLPEKWKRNLAKVWLPVTILSALFFITGLEISVFGFVPGTSDPEIILTVCWSFLFGSLLLINVSYISGYAYDLLHNKQHIQ